VAAVQIRLDGGIKNSLVDLQTAQKARVRRTSVHDIA
jgi:hypothetical protein